MPKHDFGMVGLKWACLDMWMDLSRLMHGS